MSTSLGYLVLATGWKHSVADWGSGVYATCTACQIVI